ncbi:ImmA/IrrE family metallo-endopeptidase [Sporosarcina sp. FSL W7-1283]|uniref:ImmA/IrrE family metallo-endopeptidase n=1 Tax=Sporosarcina sp. FSL W7-1283 TaxID=2921560 RepID=UPI0030FCB44F
MTQSHLEDFIESLLKEIGVFKPIHLNKFYIADMLGVYLHLLEVRSRGLWDGDIYYIFLNPNLSRQQRWQDFGHELCHGLRHAGNQKSMPSSFRKLQEWQANNFMYHFCVPTFMLRSIQLPSDQRFAAALIAETFNVEFSFAEERLKRYYQKNIFLLDHTMKEGEKLG